MGEPNDELMKSLKVYSATKYAKTRAEVEQEIQDRWNSANKAKEEAEAETKREQNMPPEPTEASKSPLSTKAAQDSAPASSDAPSASEDASGGFLDKWLSQKDD
jgi:hypothetical protein